MYIYIYIYIFTDLYLSDLEYWSLFYQLETTVLAASQITQKPYLKEHCLILGFGRGLEKMP